MTQKRYENLSKAFSVLGGFHDNIFEVVRRSPRNICLPSFLLQEAGTEWAMVEIEK